MQSYLLSRRNLSLVRLTYFLWLGKLSGFGKKFFGIIVDAPTMMNTYVAMNKYIVKSPPAYKFTVIQETIH